MMLPRYQCSCPDYQKRAAKNPNSPYFNEQINRDWSNSNAGLEPGQYCKHIWATILAEGMLKEVGVPNDPAIPEVERRSSGTHSPRLQSDITKGDYFGI